jgi:hypothetical protein
MKKILLFSLFALTVSSLMAQEEEKPKKKKQAIDMSNRPNDHFLFQLGYTSWAGKPDTIVTGGWSKSINAYFMFDFPFKTNPKLSMAFGPGIASDHIIFSKTHVGIRDNTPTLYFTNKSDTDHFRKTKLATVYLEAPVEFRFSAKPETGNGLKFAVGVKVGTMLNAHTRNVRLQNKNNTTLNDYVMKEASKKFFNKNRLVGQVRVGYGHFTIYGFYQFTSLIKDASAPQVKPWSVGLTLSGL